MMKMNPDERMTIDEIFAHPWMQGEVTSQDEIIEDFNNRKKIVDDNAHNEREEKRKNRTKNKDKNARRAIGDGSEKNEDEDPTSIWRDLDVPEYDVHVHKTTKFFTTGIPLDYMLQLTTYFEDKNITYKVNGTNL